MGWNNEKIEHEDGGFSFDTDGTDASKVGSPLYVDCIGKYHFEIADAVLKPEVVDHDAKQVVPHINVQCVVLQDVPHQSATGAFYYHKVHLAGKGGMQIEEWAKNATIAFLLGVGLLREIDGKIIDPATNSTRIDIKTVPDRLKYMQFIGDIKKPKNSDPQKFADKFELPFGRGAFRINDPAVRNVPKNVEALKLLKDIKLEDCLPLPTGANGEGDGGKKPGRPKKGEVATPAAPAQTAAPASTTAPPQQAAAASPAPSPAPAAAATPATDAYDEL